jgi:hypothetical protein
VGKLRQTFLESAGDYPYQQISSTATWDLLDEERSETTREKDIRFLDNNVVSIEKAHGPRRGPFHTVNDRKVRENADSARHPETDETPCKSFGLTSNSTRLKIVVSPVRVRVSPSGEPEVRSVAEFT